jgi:hypothetical protein
MEIEKMDLDVAMGLKDRLDARISILKDKKNEKDVEALVRAFENALKPPTERILPLSVYHTPKPEYIIRRFGFLVLPSSEMPELKNYTDDLLCAKLSVGVKLTTTSKSIEDDCNKTASVYSYSDLPQTLQPKGLLPYQERLKAHQDFVVHNDNKWRFMSEHDDNPAMLTHATLKVVYPAHGSALARKDVPVGLIRTDAEPVAYFYDVARGLPRQILNYYNNNISLSSVLDQGSNWFPYYEKDDRLRDRTV